MERLVSHTELKGGKGAHLEDEGRELETANHAVSVDVRHVLVGEHNVVLARAVVGLWEKRSNQSVFSCEG